MADQILEAPAFKAQPAADDGGGMSAVGIRDVSETPGLYGRARQVGRFLPGVVAARHKAEDSTGVRIPPQTNYCRGPMAAS